MLAPSIASNAAVPRASSASPGDVAPIVERVGVSDDPPTRLLQAQSFWRRNPGWAKTGPIGDVVRGALEHLPGGNALTDMFGATNFGCGESMIIQIGWQIRSGRQPHNPWWMQVDGDLVGDAMTAEKYVREGRAAELTGSPNLHAWASYVELSDRIKRTLGTPVGDGYTHAGSVDDVTTPLPHAPLSDSWMGASLLKRLYVKHVLNPAAARAYWTANTASVLAASEQARPVLEQLAKTEPEEARMSDAWAKSVDVVGALGPRPLGRWAGALNRLLLPQAAPLDRARTTFPQRAFVTAIEWLQDLRGAWS